MTRQMTHSHRLRATHNPNDGLLAALDLSSGRMYYRIRPRRRSREILGLLETLRARWSGEKLKISRLRRDCAQNSLGTPSPTPNSF